MIQVLQRAFGVLDMLAEAEPLTLGEMTERTGMKKPTLCLILKSLVELGAVRKVETGLYATGSTLQQLALKPRRMGAIHWLAGEAVGHLAEEIHESVVAARVYKGTRYTIAQATFDQALMVNSTLQARGTFYSCATGRVLLAFMSQAEQETVVQRFGLPPRELWAEATTPGGLDRQLARIREDGEVVLTTAAGAVRFLAVPVFGPDGGVWLALGVSLPSIRFVPSHDKRVMDGLRRGAMELAAQLALADEAVPPERPRGAAGA